jgi:hypothetical protein
MIVTYEKQYTEQKFDSFTLYSNLSFGSTKVLFLFIKNNDKLTQLMTLARLL